MLYSHVTLLMLRVVDVVAKTTVQQSARMQVAEFPGDIQVFVVMERQVYRLEKRLPSLTLHSIFVCRSELYFQCIDKLPERRDAAPYGNNMVFNEPKLRCSLYKNSTSICRLSSASAFEIHAGRSGSLWNR